MIEKKCEVEWFEYSYKMKCICGEDTLSFTDHGGSLETCDHCNRTWSFSLSKETATLMNDALHAVSEPGVKK